jgi:hypothetical protein
MRWLVLGIVLFCAGPALAAPLDGRWVWDKAICANPPGSGDIVPSVYDGHSINHYESHCDITRLTPIGSENSAWEVEMKCSGEGEEFERAAIIALDRSGDSGNPRQMIEIDRDDGMVIVRQNCDG